MFGFGSLVYAHCVRISDTAGIVADEDFSYREDLKRAGGMDIRMVNGVDSSHVRYALLLRDMPFWRDWGASALVVRCYDDEDGTITLAESAWMENRKKKNG